MHLYCVSPSGWVIDQLHMVFQEEKGPYEQIATSDISRLLTAEGKSALENGARVAVLYRPPWCLYPDENARSFVIDPERWLSFHSQVLRLRKALRDRLSVIDLSFGEIAPAQLSQLPEAIRTSFASPRIDIAIRQSMAAPELAATFPFLESFFSQQLPQLCEVHEEFNRFAIPLSRMPYAADACESEMASEGANLSNLRIKQQLTDFCEGLISKELMEQKKDLEQLLKDSQTQLNDSRAKLKDSETKLKDSETKLKDVESENDLLLAQLHQVQEELEAYYLKFTEAKQHMAAAAPLFAHGRRLLLTQAIQ